VRRIRQFTHRFVTTVPAQPEEGVLYVSIEYATAIHLCACGCRREVITPIQPTKWSMTFDGASVSLRPSIGNWSFPCRSHYWIDRGGNVRWDRSWSDQEVALSRVGRVPARPSRRSPSARGFISSLRRWLTRGRPG
jgi:Family of unknown function (DUF6527)